jgi:hypothetical protein
MPHNAFGWTPDLRAGPAPLTLVLDNNTESSSSTRWFYQSDVTPAQTWQLIEYCAERGATEFAVCLMTMQGSAAPNIAEVAAALRPFERPAAPRELMTVPMGQPQVQLTRLWRLVPEAIAALRPFLSEGLFDYRSADWDTGWLEDLTVYRDGAVMLGVVSHEGEGVLTLSPAEHAEVAALGIRTQGAPRTYPLL